MRRNRTMICVLAAVLLMLAVLAGCTKKDTKAAEKESPSPDVPQETAPTGVAVPGRGCAIEFPDGKRYHYDMDLTLDPDARTVSGHVAFTFFNDSEDAWDKLCLRDYPSLFADGVTDGAMTAITGMKDGRDGSALEFEREKDVSVLWVPLSEPLEPGAEMTLEYDFKATIPTLDDRFGVSNSIFNVTNFYPILAEYVDGDWSHVAFFDEGECFYSEISDYDVTLTVPADYAVVSTGTETNKEKSGDTVTYTYAAPCVRDFVFSASDSFVVQDATYDGVHVNVAYNADNPPSDDMEPFVEASLKAAEDSLAAFGDAFGVYPYDELDIVFSPMAAGGMEYPNLVIISEDYCGDYAYDAPEDKNDPQPASLMIDLQICVAHEIGHQWFMGIVGSDSGMEPWLDESITSYTELVYLAYTNAEEYEWTADAYGREAFDLTEERITNRGRRLDYFPLNRAYYEFSDYVYSIYGYGKAAVFQMEQILGADVFQEVLREYVHRFAFTNADSEDFFTVLYDVVGKDNEALNALIAGVFDL